MTLEQFKEVAGYVLSGNFSLTLVLTNGERLRFSTKEISVWCTDLLPSGAPFDTTFVAQKECETYDIPLDIILYTIVHKY